MGSGYLEKRYWKRKGYGEGTEKLFLEGLNGAGCFLMLTAKGMNVWGFLYSLMTSTLLLLSLTDWKRYEIPRDITGFLFFLGFLSALLDWSHAGAHIGGVAAAAPFWFFYLATGDRYLGGGDIKLLTAGGLLLGGERLMQALFLASLSGFLCHIFRMKFFGAGRELAFGPYLSAGIVLAAL